MKLFYTAFGFVLLLVPIVSDAQEVHQEIQGVWKAEVLTIEEEYKRMIPGTETETLVQIITAEIMEGERKGSHVQFENDFIPLRKGQSFFLNYLITINGDEIYSVRDINRQGFLFGLLALFMVVVIWFGRWQGIRSLISLAASLCVVLFVLVPVLVAGYNPIAFSVLIGTLILFVAIFFTHGFSWQSLVAFVGTSITIVITGFLAWGAIELLQLSGFFSDETVYLNFGTQGALDFRGLLLGGIIIGVLGVLDDIAITQVAVVHELQQVSNTLARHDIYRRALRVGREHVSALVNTIVLAYAGVSLPLLLWFSQSEASFGTIVNNEVFATEIARTIVGSIGLILAVPITTGLAVMFAHKFKAHVHIGHSH